jgi:RNA-binding protein YlmH
LTAEEKLLLAKVEDLFRLCDKYSAPQFSAFLNEAEKAFIEKNVGVRMGYNSCFFGGYDEAMRTVFGVFPEWEESCVHSFPIKTIKIIKKYNKELSHRDYLGTVLSNGINRELVGDILVNDGEAYVFILADMADFVASGIDKVANVGVKTLVEEISDIEVPKPKFETINTVAASLRLDAVVAAMLRLSRKEASSLIIGEKVSINHLICQNVSHILKENDIISVRGSGRFEFSKVQGTTRSDRLHIMIKKYI